LSTPAYAPTASLPRVLEGVPAAGAMSLQQHLATHGEIPGSLRGSPRAGQALIEELDQAGLRGRGGGGFPAAAKLRAVAGKGGKRARGAFSPRPIVVVNGVEGEPASLKDRTLLEALPQLVLDGASAAAEAVGADEVVVCVCESAEAAHASITHAIRERKRAGYNEARWHVARVPVGYITGQESALVSFLNGKPAKPTFTPPMPYERGVRQRPTLVNNPETLAHLALIARHGASWFRTLGTPEHPGSALVTLGGHVAAPGVYEIEYGSSLTSLIDAAGGLTDQVRAVLVGGYAGSWIDGGYLPSLALCDEDLAPYGAKLGTGVVMVLGASSCGLAETTRVTRWLAQESAGQCGPCKFGLEGLAHTLEGALNGVADLPDTDHRRRLAHLMSVVRGRGACSHPDGTVRFLGSAVEVFAPELADHMQHGRCAACAHAGTLPLPAGRAPRMRLDEHTYGSARRRMRVERAPGSNRYAGAARDATAQLAIDGQEERRR
jgi:NADH:ubiquinone oxidoreductase subunit F (NADH-binding)